MVDVLDGDDVVEPGIVVLVVLVVDVVDVVVVDVVDVVDVVVVVVGSVPGSAANQVWYNWYANGRQRWVNAHSRRCLDADTNTLNIPNVPTKIQLWDCLNASNQDWRP